MNCEDYRQAFERFGSSPVTREVLDSDDFMIWSEHGHDCSRCSDWASARKLDALGVDVSAYPCVHLALRCNTTCSDHEDPWECPDAIIVETRVGFGIPIRDGGRSSVAIEFCPWCGAKATKIG